MSISLKELLKNADFNNQTKEIQDNLMTLLERINKVREAWGQPMTVTSGLRDHADQIRIYTEKGVPEDKIPWGSQHLTGGAVDIYDPDKKLQEWCLANVDKLESIGLWMEDFSTTKNWCHFQVLEPKSGKRFFMP